MCQYLICHHLVQGTPRNTPALDCLICAIQNGRRSDTQLWVPGINGRSSVAHRRSRESHQTEYIKFKRSTCRARLWRSGKFAGGVPEIVAMVTGSVGRFPCNKLPRWSEVRRGRVEAVVVSPDASEEEMS